MTRRSDAARLASLLEGSVDVSDGAVSTEERQMAGLATLLRDAAPEVPPMRPEFRAELRAQVLAAAREQQAESPLLTRLRDRVQRFKYSTGLAGATGLASVAIAGGGVAGAAEFAQPGDLLYGTKLTIEDARLALTPDEVGRGRRAISYALDRMEEAQQAARAGDGPGVAIALEGAAERTAEGQQLIVEHGDSGDLLDLADALEREEQMVLSLLPHLDGEATVAADGLLAVVEEARDAIGSVLAVPPGGSVLPQPDVTVTTTPIAPPPAGESESTTDPLDVIPTVPDSDPDGTGEVLPTAPPPAPTVPQPTTVPIPGLPDDDPVPLPDLPSEVPDPGAAVDDLEATVSDTVEGVSDTVEDVGGAVGDTVEDVGGTVGDTVEDVGETLEEAVDGVIDGFLGGG